MNNKEFIADLAQRAGYTQADTQKMVTDIIEYMGQRFEEGDSVQIANFGTFEVKKRLERIVVNPGTQQRMLVPPKLVLNFKPVASIKEELKNT
ncbi:MAG: HU family DNA-binding protein [Prevotella sp.]|nr:HU family DNA-binding protein [Prevotella sp.]